MAKREKTRYESANIEVLLIKTEDVISTSGFNNSTEYVDPDENAWVSVGNGGWN